VFDVDDRDRAYAHVLDMASADPRIVAAAVVGSQAHGKADRWADIDLTFAVAERATVVEVLAEWSRELETTLDAAHLFDLPVGETVYRVFMLPGCLQVDLSFTPVREFRPRGPQFRLLFGSAGKPAVAPAPESRHLLGLAVHHVVRARICVERGHPRQAEYWISGARDIALGLACRRHGLPDQNGRGFDALPEAVLEPLDGGLGRSLEPRELLRALECVVDGLVHELAELPDRDPAIEARLRELV